MPIIAAVIGAVLTGLLYWFVWGGGMEYVDARLHDNADRKRRAVRDQQREAASPLRSISDPREGATILMMATGLARGVLTPEQIGVIEDQMRKVLGYEGNLIAPVACSRVAAEGASSPEAAVDDLTDILRRSLTRAEKAELEAMLERVAALHGGPTDRQERLVALVRRRLAVA